MVGIIVSYLFTLVPIVVTLIVMAIIYTVYETLLPIALILISTGAFIVAFVAVRKKTSVFYLTLYFGFHLIISLILGVFVPIYIPVSACELIMIITSVKVTSKSRKYFPVFEPLVHSKPLRYALLSSFQQLQYISIHQQFHLQ